MKHVLLLAFQKVCFHPGVRLAIGGNVRVYPYAGDKHEMRTSKATRQHALLAQLSGTDGSIIALSTYSSYTINSLLCIVYLAQQNGTKPCTRMERHGKKYLTC